MNSYVALIIFAGLVAFIVSLYVRRKRIENGMANFYKDHSLYTTENSPAIVRESLGASDNIFCCKANLTMANGASVEFCWWEWYLKSTTMINGVPSASFTQFLAVSFAPNSVSDEFVQKAIRLADTSGDDFSQKAKDFFVTNTETPYRAEILADGSLIICWRTVVKRREIYEAKLEWLKKM